MGSHYEFCMMGFLSWFRNQTLSYLTMITNVVIENETIHQKHQHNKDKAFSSRFQGQAFLS